jgi:hypothetical protein
MLAVTVPRPTATAQRTSIAVFLKSLPVIQHLLDLLDDLSRFIVASPLDGRTRDDSWRVALLPDSPAAGAPLPFTKVGRVAPQAESG